MTPHQHCLISSHQVPPGSAWLGPRERAIEVGLTRAHRREDWRRGRFAAKSLLAEGNQDLSRIDIDAAPDGAPRVWIDGRLRPVGLSISHRSDFAAAAVAPEGRTIGIDLEQIEPRTQRFVQDYFTQDEVQRYWSMPEELRDIYTVGVWSAKEGVLKCARTGLRRDTRSVEIELHPVATADVWHTLYAYDCERALDFHGWWRRERDLLLTVVSPKTEPLPKNEAHGPRRPASLSGRPRKDADLHARP